MIHNKALGEYGEKIAQFFLSKIGYLILEKNYKCKFGEVDLIARTNNLIIFVEVKTRSNLSYGYPEESIEYFKIQKIKNIANYFITRKNLESFDVRFDVISIKLDIKHKDFKNIEFSLIEDFFKNNNLTKIKNRFNLRHIMNAF